MTNTGPITSINLAPLSNAELVQRFSDIAFARGQTNTIDPTYDDGVSPEGIADISRLYGLLVATHDELKSRQPDARSGLTQLYSHPSAWVRLDAARFSYAVAPQEARTVLEA